jgi:hypothetical protein
MIRFRRFHGGDPGMAYSINGFGTTFYGSADPHPDGSYVVTTWIIAAAIPLIPLGSMRVLPVRDGSQPGLNGSQRYRTMKVPLHRPHLLKGWAVTLAIVLFFVVVALVNRGH